MMLTVSTYDIATMVATELGFREVNIIYQPEFQSKLMEYSKTGKGDAAYPILSTIYNLKLVCLSHGVKFNQIESYNPNLDVYRISVDAVDS